MHNILLRYGYGKDISSFGTTSRFDSYYPIHEMIIEFSKWAFFEKMGYSAEIIEEMVQQTDYKSWKNDENLQYVIAATWIDWIIEELREAGCSIKWERLLLLSVEIVRSTPTIRVEDFAKRLLYEYKYKKGDSGISDKEPLSAASPLRLNKARSSRSTTLTVDGKQTTRSIILSVRPERSRGTKCVEPTVSPVKGLGFVSSPLSTKENSSSFRRKILTYSEYCQWLYGGQISPLPKDILGYDLRDVPYTRNFLPESFMLIETIREDAIFGTSGGKTCIGILAKGLDECKENDGFIFHQHHWSPRYLPDLKDDLEEYTNAMGNIKQYLEQKKTEIKHCLSFLNTDSKLILVIAFREDLYEHMQVLTEYLLRDEELSHISILGIECLLDKRYKNQMQYIMGTSEGFAVGICKGDIIQSTVFLIQEEEIFVLRWDQIKDFLNERIIFIKNDVHKKERCTIEDSVVYRPHKILIKFIRSSSPMEESILIPDTLNLGESDFTEIIAREIVEALERYDIFEVRKSASKYLYHARPKTQPEPYLIEKAIKETWSYLEDNVGSVKSICTMMPDEFANKIEAIEFGLVAPPFLLDKPSLELLRKTREVAGDANLLWQMVLDALEYTPLELRELFNEIIWFHPSVQKEGIYYSLKFYQLIGIPVTKTDFFHELFEKKSIENGAIDPIFSKFFSHSHLRITGEDLKFSSKMGELDQRIKFWRMEIERMENNITSGLIPKTYEQVVKKYLAQMNEILEINTNAEALQRNAFKPDEGSSPMNSYKNTFKSIGKVSISEYSASSIEKRDSVDPSHLEFISLEKAKALVRSSDPKEVLIGKKAIYTHSFRGAPINRNPQIEFEGFMIHRAFYDDSAQINKNSIPEINQQTIFATEGCSNCIGVIGVQLNEEGLAERGFVLHQWHLPHTLKKLLENNELKNKESNYFSFCEKEFRDLIVLLNNGKQLLIIIAYHYEVEGRVLDLKGHFEETPLFNHVRFLFMKRQEEVTVIGTKEGHILVPTKDEDGTTPTPLLLTWQEVLGLAEGRQFTFMRYTDNTLQRINIPTCSASPVENDALLKIFPPELTFEHYKGLGQVIMQRTKVWESLPKLFTYHIYHLNDGKKSYVGTISFTLDTLDDKDGMRGINIRKTDIFPRDKGIDHTVIVGLAQKAFKNNMKLGRFSDFWPMHSGHAPLAHIFFKFLKNIEISTLLEGDNWRYATEAEVIRLLEEDKLILLRGDARKDLAKQYRFALIRYPRSTMSSSSQSPSSPLTQGPGSPAGISSHKSQVTSHKFGIRPATWNVRQILYPYGNGSSSPLTQKRKTIMVVDDEESLRNALGGILVDEGYIALTVRDVKNALEELKNKTVDLVIVKHNLYPAGGKELCIFMAKDENLRNIPIIVIIQGFEDKESITQEYGNGLKQVLTRDEISYNIFIEAVRDVFKKSSSPMASRSSSPLGVNNHATLKKSLVKFKDGGSGGIFGENNRNFYVASASHNYSFQPKWRDPTPATKIMNEIYDYQPSVILSDGTEVRGTIIGTPRTLPRYADLALCRISKREVPIGAIEVSPLLKLSNLSKVLGFDAYLLGHPSDYQSEPLASLVLKTLIESKAELNIIPSKVQTILRGCDYQNDIVYGIDDKKGSSIILKGLVPMGYSGGPVLLQKGELIGIMTQSGFLNEFTIANSVETIVEMLNLWLGCPSPTLTKGDKNAIQNILRKATAASPLASGGQFYRSSSSLSRLNRNGLKGVLKGVILKGIMEGPGELYLALSFSGSKIEVEGWLDLVLYGLSEDLPEESSSPIYTNDLPPMEEEGFTQKYVISKLENTLSDLKQAKIPLGNKTFLIIPPKLKGKLQIAKYINNILLRRKDNDLRLLISFYLLNKNMLPKMLWIGEEYFDLKEVSLISVDNLEVRLSKDKKPMVLIELEKIPTEELKRFLSSFPIRAFKKSNTSKFTKTSSSPVKELNTQELVSVDISFRTVLSLVVLVVMMLSLPGKTTAILQLTSQSNLPLQVSEIIIKDNAQSNTFQKWIDQGLSLREQGDFKASARAFLRGFLLKGAEYDFPLLMEDLNQGRINRRQFYRYIADYLEGVVLKDFEQTAQVPEISTKIKALITELRLYSRQAKPLKPELAALQRRLRELAEEISVSSKPNTERRTPNAEQSAASRPSSSPVRSEGVSSEVEGPLDLRRSSSPVDRMVSWRTPSQNSSSPIKEKLNPESLEDVRRRMSRKLDHLEKHIENWMKVPRIYLEFMEQSIFERLTWVMEKDPLIFKKEFWDGQPERDLFRFFKKRSLGEVFERELNRRVAEIQAKAQQEKIKQKQNQRFRCSGSPVVDADYRGLHADGRRLDLQSQTTSYNFTQPRETFNLGRSSSPAVSSDSFKLTASSLQLQAYSLDLSRSSSPVRTKVIELNKELMEIANRVREEKYIWEKSRMRGGIPFDALGISNATAFYPLLGADVLTLDEARKRKIKVITIDREGIFDFPIFLHRACDELTIDSGEMVGERVSEGSLLNLDLIEYKNLVWIPQNIEEDKGFSILEKYLKDRNAILDCVIFRYLSGNPFDNYEDKSDSAKQTAIDNIIDRTMSLLANNGYIILLSKDEAVLESLSRYDFTELIFPEDFYNIVFNPQEKIVKEPIIISYHHDTAINMFTSSYCKIFIKDAGVGSSPLVADHAVYTERKRSASPLVLFRSSQIERNATHNSQLMTNNSKRRSATCSSPVYNPTLDATVRKIIEGLNNIRSKKYSSERTIKDISLPGVLIFNVSEHQESLWEQLIKLLNPPITAETTREILNMISEPYDKEIFIGLLAANDPKRIAFQRISAEELLPLKAISVALGEQDFKIKYNFRDYSIAACLVKPSTEGLIVTLTIESQNVLETNSRFAPDEISLESSIADFLGNKATGSFVKEVGGHIKTYLHYNLNWAAYISNLDVSHPFRCRGIGGAIYSSVEGYLSRCGFNIIAVKGVCPIENPEFYRKRGFSRAVIIADMGGGNREFISLKVLPSSSPQKKHPAASPLVNLVAPLASKVEDFLKGSVIKDTLYHGVSSYYESNIESILQEGFNVNMPTFGICRAFGNAVYLTTTKEEAAYWAKRHTIREKSIIILEAIANIQNPRIYIFGPDYREAFRRIFPNGWSKKAAEELQEKLKKEGHDSIILKSEYTIGLNQVIVFNPEDVKVVNKQSFVSSEVGIGNEVVFPDEVIFTRSDVKQYGISNLFGNKIVPQVAKLWSNVNKVIKNLPGIKEQIVVVDFGDHAEHYQVRDHVYSIIYEFFNNAYNAGIRRLFAQGRNPLVSPIDEARLSARLVREGNNLAIRIKDNGAGIIRVVGPSIETPLKGDNYPGLVGGKIIRGRGIWYTLSRIKGLGGTIEWRSPTDYPEGLGTEISVILPVFDSSSPISGRFSSSLRKHAASPRRSSSPLKEDKEIESKIKDLMKKGIIKKEIYRKGLPEYEGLRMLLVHGDTDLVSRLHTHASYVSKEGLLGKASNFFGWLESRFGREAIEILFKMFNSVNFPWNHHKIFVLASITWDEESMEFFIKIISEGLARNEKAAPILESITDAYYRGDRGEVFIETLKELAKENRIVSFQEIADIVANKIKSRVTNIDSSPLATHLFSSPMTSLGCRVTTKGGEFRVPAREVMDRREEDIEGHIII